MNAAMVIRLAVVLLYYAVGALVLLSALISFVPAWRWTPWGRLVHNITEPMFRPFRRILPTVAVSRGMAVDLAPIAVLVLAYVIQLVLLRVLPIR
jgi:YggT family protein